MTAAKDLHTCAFISLGSNLPSGKGDPLQTLAFAGRALEELTDEPLLKSSIYASSPVDSPAGTPDFFNAVIALVPLPMETAVSLLGKLQAIENAAGRKRSGIKNAARSLDLDLISFGDDICNTPDLVLPHPRAHERRFVLEPLVEIAGKQFTLPGMTATLGQLLAAIPKAQKLRKLPPG